MPVNKEIYQSIKSACDAKGVSLIAVSKTKPNEDILELYELGQRDFGENYVQELESKYESLPKDIRWHFIGHLQSNKVKNIANFVHLIHGVDSEKLLKEINKQAVKFNRVVPCLLQVHIAKEETKFGMDEEELSSVFSHLGELRNVSVQGLMGMASFSDDMDLVRSEFKNLSGIFKEKHDAGNTTVNTLQTLSMGMSADYAIAIEEGSTMIRVGSLLFGKRN